MYNPIQDMIAMENMLFEPIIQHGIVFDTHKGIGAKSFIPSKNEDTLLVGMRPSIFLLLASPLIKPRYNLEWLSNYIQSGRPVCPSAIKVWVSQNNSMDVVIAHDGRHRMLAVLEVLGDRKIPVRLLLKNTSSFTPALITRINHGLRSQKTSLYIQGPLFDENCLNDLDG
jgi:hypothetical protein